MSCYMSADVQDPVSTETTPDWHLAQLLHAQAVPLAEIVSRCNVSLASLGKRIQREEWVKKREESRRTVSVKVSSPQAERNEQTLAPLATASANVRRIISDELLSLGTNLGTIKVPKSLKAIESRLDVLCKYVSVARPTYSWDSSGSGMGVLSVTNLESARPPTPVTDVSAVVVPEQSMLSDSPEQGKAG